MKEYCILLEIECDYVLKHTILSSLAIPSIKVMDITLNVSAKATEFSSIKALYLLNFLYKKKPIIKEHISKRFVFTTFNIKLRKIDALREMLKLKDYMSKSESWNSFKQFSIDRNGGDYLISIRDISSLYYLGLLKFDYFSWKNIINLRISLDLKNKHFNLTPRKRIYTKVYWSMMGVTTKK